MLKWTNYPNPYIFFKEEELFMDKLQNIKFNNLIHELATFNKYEYNESIHKKNIYFR